MLVGLLAAAGCGESSASQPVRNDVFPDLNCGEKPNNTITRTYDKMTAEQQILLGHTVARGSEIIADVAVSVTGEKAILMKDLHRGEGDIQAKIEGASDGGYTITSGNEQFAVSPWADATIHIVGKCIQPAQS